MANIVYCSVLFWTTNPVCIQDRLLGRHAALRVNRNLFSAWPDWYGGYLWQIGVLLADSLPVSRLSCQDPVVLDIVVGCLKVIVQVE
jgi:hypothetical protein